jgi:hypothetical protein
MVDDRSWKQLSVPPALDAQRMLSEERQSVALPPRVVEVVPVGRAGSLLTALVSCAPPFEDGEARTPRLIAEPPGYRRHRSAVSSSRADGGATIRRHRLTNRATFIIELTVTKTYTCDNCGGTFEAGWSEEEAEAESVRNFGQLDPKDRATVCDVCYRQIMRAASS